MRIETRLHRARIDRGIDLSDLATRTRLSPHVLKKIDEGRFADLPAGVYARAYVRAFAAAVGLEPSEAVQELGDVLPPAENPLEGLREAVERSYPAPGWARAQAALVSRVRNTWTACRAGHIWRRCCSVTFSRYAASSRLARWSPRSGILAGNLVRETRAAASALDAIVLLTIDAALVLLIATACAVPIGTLLEQAGAFVSMFCAIPVALYFLVFDGVGGRTPGAWLCRLPASDTEAPLRLRTIFMRTVKPERVDRGSGRTLQQRIANHELRTANSEL